MTFVSYASIFKRRQTIQLVPATTMKLILTLLSLFFVAMTGCTSDPSPNQTPALGPDDLPINRSFTDPKELINEPETVMPTRYRRFLQDAQAILDSIAEPMTLPALKTWTRSLAQYPVNLEYHQYWNEGAEEAHMVGFSLHEDVDAPLNSYPGATLHLELLEAEKVPSGTPLALQEVYTLGKLWLFGFSASGYFMRPENLKLASEVEYLKDYLEDYKASGSIVPDDLVAFYTDSGCWLMYDEEETVYCGGVECGDFWNSGLKIDTVINTVFQRMLDGERIFIESFAPNPNSR